MKLLLIPRLEDRPLSPHRLPAFESASDIWAAVRAGDVSAPRRGGEHPPARALEEVGAHVVYRLVRRERELPDAIRNAVSVDQGPTRRAGSCRLELGL